MKKNLAGTAEPIHEFADLEALRELDSLIEQRTKLEQASEKIPAEIEQAQSDLEAIGAQIAAAELALLDVSDKQLPAALKQRDALEEKHLAAGLQIRRLRSKLAAIEAKMPDLDAQIELSVGAVRIEASMASEALQVSLAEELRAKVSEISVIFAKVRVLQRLVPMNRTSDFLVSAYVPDLETCMRVNTGTSHYDAAPNLLEIASESTKAAEAEIAEAMKPITDALIKGRQHKPYVPLDKRPSPYVHRGSNSGPVKGLGGAIGPGEPPVPFEPTPSPFKGYRTDQPYEVKSDMGGCRTRDASAAEMNMSAAIAAAADSASR